MIGFLSGNFCTAIWVFYLLLQRAILPCFHLQYPKMFGNDGRVVLLQVCIWFCYFANFDHMCVLKTTMFLLWKGASRCFKIKNLNAVGQIKHFFLLYVWQAMRRRVYNGKDWETYGIVLFMVLWIVCANQKTSCPPTIGLFIALCVILFFCDCNMLYFNAIRSCFLNTINSREEVWGKYSSNRSDMFKSLLIHTPC